MYDPPFTHCYPDKKLHVISYVLRSMNGGPPSLLHSIQTDIEPVTLHLSQMMSIGQ